MGFDCNVGDFSLMLETFISNDAGALEQNEKGWKFFTTGWKNICQK